MNDDEHDQPPPTPTPAPSAAPELPAAQPAAAKPAKPLAQGLTAAEARAWLESLQLGESARDPAPDAAAEPVQAEQAAEATEAQPAAEPPEPLPPFPRSVLVLGLGESGLAMARWCVARGADVVVADTREQPPGLPRLLADLPQARFAAGPFAPELLEGVEAVYRSPGLAPSQIADLSAAAAGRGVPLAGELSLFTRGLQQLRAEQGYAPAVLAVTGTNGKTTVTSLVGQLVERSGRTVAVAGNIGPTLLDTLAQRIASGALPQVWALELSSFQLEGAEGFEPTAAAVLNVTQDHLDWHGGMDAYAAAKARIFGQGALMVLNREDPTVMRMRPAPVRLRGGKMEQRAAVTFGADLPQRPGDFGIEVINGMAWLVRAHDADETQKRRKGEEEELHFQRLMPADGLRIRGRHNAVNALAALALASATGAALGPMLYGLREYRGEPHRVEPIGTVVGVEYFDDSKGTNVGATVAALAGLGAERKVVVILGGDGKGQDFSPLAEPVSRFARAAVLIGRDGPQIRAVLENSGVPLLDAGSMEEAVKLATQRSHAGDAVLMSPACASFDMFRNYEHRAEVFRAAVSALADEAGSPLEGQA
ncbi:UDP-N-acetylmuramoyl-L-alanine--D-glutamate ligase [Ramlibacter humi]|uniref:UDP-N-acetylmuramoylalanine--D-glutamate ligase n=1 Tax=Ramlibacter humi TaxID=2530451 RepID=A0A4Z0BHR9_9BURK|nr:UDP-N-acetylmuramoyl-L-alanine--D-glutamate ligase [Ramlibacter humi]TFY98852.1 UDP-N-acetylmuramoyl-L-alanine--D-glutamate ligase [Ramlibacter humi]